MRNTAWAHLDLVGPVFAILLVDRVVLVTVDFRIPESQQIKSDLCRVKLPLFDVLDKLLVAPILSVAVTL